MRMVSMQGFLVLLTSTKGEGMREWQRYGVGVVLTMILEREKEGCAEKARIYTFRGAETIAVREGNFSLELC